MNLQAFKRAYVAFVEELARVLPSWGELPLRERGDWANELGYFLGKRVAARLSLRESERYSFGLSVQQADADLRQLSDQIEAAMRFRPDLALDEDPCTTTVFSRKVVGAPPDRISIAG